MVALEQLDDVEAGDDLLAVRLQVIPLRCVAGLGQRQRGLEAEQQGENGAGKRAFHGLRAT
ncbi:hypothetical protein D3C77_793600 [compost metagenome]